MVKKILLIMIIMGITSCTPSNEIQRNTTTQENENTQKGETMQSSEFTDKISIIINEKELTATIEDNETTRAFLELLPLEINMQELNGNEKYYNLAKVLPSSPSKINNINKGDIMLYTDNCLVLFYESFNTSYSYTRIGKIDNPELLNDLAKTGSVKVLFTK